MAALAPPCPPACIPAPSTATTATTGTTDSPDNPGCMLLDSLWDAQAICSRAPGCMAVAHR